MNEPRKFYEQVGVAMTCRSYTEYEKMFVLNEEELQNGVILDIAAGASSFTAVAKSKGFKAIAVDPLYLKSVPDMAEFGLNEITSSTDKLSKLTQAFDWSYYGSPELHRENRLRSLDVFMNDYARADANLTYFTSALPVLSFASNTFSLILCSHFLFLYQEQFDYSFHINAVIEMLRVCQVGGQIRIYPIYDFKGLPFPNLQKLMNQIQEHGAIAELAPSQLPFIPGSTHYLKISKL
ncbi:methylase [Paenibacillus psychroresistens]|uniref:Methylase n=1 Tax=Paenibacillus psychroresistens TaxID=1778678 RepID=A0A6B8RM36_9BACL|nr:methylase [Paenibacillus psychroresistens]QGQ97461.1 methylase [Paenibacillus psychroresistens]